MTSSVLANSKYLQGRLLALIDPTREATRVLTGKMRPAGGSEPASDTLLR